MNTWAAPKQSGFHIPIRRGVWLPIVFCLITLIARLAAAGDLNESYGKSNPPGRGGHACWRVAALAGAEASFSTLDAAHSAAGAHRLFASPAETETPDIEPVMLKCKKIAVHAIARPAAERRVSTIARRPSVPLYLTLRSLLC